MRGKLEQEEAVRGSSVPYTILRATQFFEFIGRIADSSMSGDAVHLPPVRIQPEAADDAYRTWRSGSIQTLPTSPQTLADGVRTTAIGARNFEVMFANRLVDEIVLVSEAEIADAVRTAWTRVHLALEPTGALTLAAYLARKLPQGRTGLILSGGNANLQTVATLLAR